MSRNVEKRVAELEFRNQQFETAAKESIGTLQRLEESLAFKTAEKGVSGLESIIKTLNKFNPITNMLNHLTSAFETARQRISVGFFDQIGYDVENLSKKFIDFLGPEYIKTGFNKYEQEIGSVQTLVNTTGKGTKEVMKYTEKLRWFTDETSYYYDDMISNLGRFTSAGVKIDDAMTSLIGIADAAGYFGVNASNASHAMTGFANAIASGVMSAQNWKWIETAHLDVEGFKNALIEAGVAMGTLQKSSSGVTTTLKGTEVTAANFRTTLRDGWLTTEAMNKAFAKFGKATDDIYDKLNELSKTNENITTRDVVEDYAEFFDTVGLEAFKASQETKTFTDAIEYVRTAVASNWSKTWQIIIGDYDDARDVWGSVVDDLYDLFVASGEARNNMLENWKEANGRTELLASIRNFYEGIKAAVRPIQQVWAKLFPKKTGEEIAKMTQALNLMSQKFRAVFEGIAEIFEPVVEAVDDFCDDISKRVQVVTEPVERTAELLDKLANAVIHGDYGNGQVRRDALQGLAYSYEEIQNRVNELLGYSFRYEVTQQEIAEGAKEVSEAVEEENEELEEQRFQIENADSRIGRVQRTFAGIYAAGLTFMKVMKEIGSGIVSVFGTIKDEILMPLVDWVLSFTSVWGDSMVEMYAKGEVFESIKKTIQDTVSSVNKWITKFANNFRTKIYPSIGPFFSAVIDFAKNNIPNLWKIVKSGLKIAIGLVTNLWKIVEPFIPTLETIAGFIVDKLTWGIEKLAEYTPTITDKLGGAFEWVSEKVVTLVTNVQELWNQFSISSAWSRLKTSMQGVGDLFSDLGQIIHDTFFKIFGANADYDEFAENGPGQAITRSLEPAPEAEDNKNKMLGFVESIANGISDFAEKITAKKEEIKNFFALFTDGLANNIRIIGNSVTNVVNGVKTFGEQSWTGFTNVLTQIDQMSEGSLTIISTGISEFFGSLTETVKNFDTSKLNTVFESVLKGGGLLALLNFSEGFANIGNNLAAVPRTFNELLLTAQGTLLSYQKKINATNLEKIAKAIGILALSVVGLTFVDQDKLSNATASIIGLGLVAAAILKVAAPWIEAKAKLEGVKATAEQAKETQKMIADNGPAVLLSIFVQPLKDLATGLSNAARIWAGKHKMSVFLISVGITLTLIMNLLERMKEMQKDLPALQAAGTNLALMAVALFVFALAMSKINKSFEKVSTIGKGKTNIRESNFNLSFSVALIAMVTSMMILVEAVGNLAALYKQYGWDTIQNTLGGMIILMVGLAGVMYVASKIEHGGAVAAAMISLAATMNLMMIPVLVLGKYKGSLKRGLGGLFALEALLAIFLVVIIGLNKMTKEWGGGDSVGGVMANFALGLVALSGAMLLLGVACGVLSLIGWDTIAAGMVKIGTAMVLLAGVGWLLSLIPGMTQSMTTLAKNMLMLSAAALMLGIALPFITNGLIALGQGIEDHGKELAIGFTVILGAILAAVVASKSGMVSAIQTFLSGGLEGIFKFIADPNNRALMIAGIFILVNIILAAIEALIPGTVDKIIYLLVLLLDTIAKVILERGGQVFRAMWHIVESLYLLLAEILDDVLGPIADAACEVLGIENKFDRNLEDAKNNLTRAIEKNIEDAKNTTKDDISSAIDDITYSTQNGVSHAAGKFGETASTELDNAKQQVDSSSQEIIDPLIENTQSGLATATTTAQNGFGGLANVFGSFNLGTFDQENLTNYFSGLDMTQFFDEKGNINMEAFTGAMTDYLQQNVAPVADAAEEVGTEVSDAGAEVLDDGGDYGGQMYGYGAARGIRSTLDVVRAAAKELGDTIIASGNGALGVRSPSTKAFESGMYYDMGLANGINAYAHLATKASEDLSYGTVDSARNALYNVSQALNSDLDSTSPVITPVLDLSDVRGGLNNVNGLFDETRKSLSGASMSVTNTIRHRDELAKEMANANNKALMDKLDNLNGSLGTLGTSMSGLQIVMDSGTLVGEIASPMDSELGIRTQRRIRGV